MRACRNHVTNLLVIVVDIDNVIVLVNIFLMAENYKIRRRSATCDMKLVHIFIKIRQFQKL
jgi:hypothetical protein